MPNLGPHGERTFYKRRNRANHFHAEINGESGGVKLRRDRSRGTINRFSKEEQNEKCLQDLPCLHFKIET